MKITIPKLSHAACTGLLLILLFCTLKPSAQNIDFGKSYINVTKGISGGTVEPGDTLEIRSSFVVRSGTYDSCGYTDVIPAGTSYIPNTVRVLTNEGKIYKQFTDPAGDDEGWISGTNVFINLGYNQASAPARWNRRGRVGNTGTTTTGWHPNVFGNTCLMIASYRVIVTASLGSVISTGGGTMTYEPSGSSTIQTYTFPNNYVAVYKNLGICANAIGTNALGTESNGTFGSGKPRNRGTSANVPPSYTYNIFTANTPNDYYYGIANNTSTQLGYTTSNAWAKPDVSATTHRVFQFWDIIGDHTGAASLSAGNPAADTVANPNAGYMLVVNASYRIDSAFQQTISNLCPNTYYEISCWMRNICSKCGCDSLGRGSGTTNYIPTATGDSSGVYPNLTFEVDGIDYYTTGNILYTNTWVKKGFTFLTGPSQTSFVLKFFNNAPGGGGNDWALDDITVATCGPNLAFTPTNHPTICMGNVVDIGSYVRSYFNNYTFYKWQKSIDNGVTWVDTGVSGSGSPTWNGSAYEYFTAYPQFIATLADNNTKFRVVVATTAANISNAGCAFADVSSILTLSVVNCGPPLHTNFISFTGHTEVNHNVLLWTIANEVDGSDYAIEKSTDGVHFTAIATMPHATITDGSPNSYTWTDPEMTNAKDYYRIRLTHTSMPVISRTIVITTRETAFDVKVTNPFTGSLSTIIEGGESNWALMRLVDNSGKMVHEHRVILNGITRVEMEQTANLSPGMYTLLVQNDKGNRVTCKVIKL